MNKKIYSIFFSIILLLNTSAYAHTANIQNQGENKYKAITLLPQIYNNSNSDLSDLLIYDEKNEPIPYFINSYNQNTENEARSFDMRLVDSFVKDEYYYYDYALSKSYNNDIAATSINVETKSVDFAKKVEIFGGYDNKNWEKIKDDTIYRVSDSAKLDVLFDKPLKYTHYRFKIADSAEKISFSAVTLKYSDTVISKEYFKQTAKADFSVEEKDKQTVIKVSGFKNIKIDKIIIETDSTFKRNVSFNGKGKMLYKLAFNNTVYSDTEIDAGGYKDTNDTFNIIINNKDDKPIEIKGITIWYFVDELIFEAKGKGFYTLHFGEGKNTVAPVYDIANYKDMILKQNIDRLSIESVNIEQEKEEKTTYDYKLIFNIVITLVALLLGVLIVLKLKKK